MPQTKDAKGRFMQKVLAADTLTGDTVVNRRKGRSRKNRTSDDRRGNGPRRLRSSLRSGDSWVWVTNCLPFRGVPSR